VNFLDEPPIFASAAGQLASQGILGLCVLALGFVVWRLWMALQDSNNARIAAAERYAAMTLEVSRASTAASVAQTASNDRMEDSMKEVLASIRRTP